MCRAEGFRGRLPTSSTQRRCLHMLRPSRIWSISTPARGARLDSLHNACPSPICRLHLHPCQPDNDLESLDFEGQEKPFYKKKR